MGTTTSLHLLFHHHQLLSASAEKTKIYLQVNYTVTYDSCHYLLQLHHGEKPPETARYRKLTINSISYFSADGNLLFCAAQNQN